MARIKLIHKEDAMLEIQVLVRDTAVSRGLQDVIEACIKDLNGSYGNIVARVAEPEFVDYRDGTTSRINISEVTYSFVHCVFQVRSRSFLSLRKKKILLFGVTEPEVVFSEDGTVCLSDIVCYVKNRAIKKVVEKKISEYATQLHIKRVTFVLDTLCNTPPLEKGE